MFSIYQILLYDLRKSIRSIVKYMGRNEFLLKQVVHDDLRHFLHKMRKRQCLSEAVKDKKKFHAVKLLNKLKHPLQLKCFAFLLMVYS